MIPIRDDNPARRTPWLTWLLIGSCVGVFLWEWSLGAAALFALPFGNHHHTYHPPTTTTRTPATHVPTTTTITTTRSAGHEPGWQAEQVLPRAG